MNGTVRFAAATSALLMFFFPLSGCKSHPEPQRTASVPAPALKPAPPTPVEEKREEIGGPTWDPEWDKIVELALPPEMLSVAAGRDVRHLCPRFDAISEADKRAFWAYFFQALAAAEAGLKPTTNVRHTQPAVAVKDDVTGQTVHRRDFCSSRTRTRSATAAISTGSPTGISGRKTRRARSCSPRIILNAA